MNNIIISFLYIPHGSDESILETLKDLPKTVLYIPHGSDERRGVKRTKQKRK